MFLKSTQTAAALYVFFLQPSHSSQSSQVSKSSSWQRVTPHLFEMLGHPPHAPVLGSLIKSKGTKAQLPPGVPVGSLLPEGQVDTKSSHLQLQPNNMTEKTKSTDAYPIRVNTVKSP